MQARGEGNTLRQPADTTAESVDPNPYGVESGSTAGQGKSSEPGNPLDVSFGMAEATGDHDQRGRSLHSSPRTGKPSTWRRQAVDTASTQEEGPSGSGLVNTGFILDMQCKLYCWSRKREFPRTTATLGCAWKAGCGETRTSGLGRGVRKPAIGRWRGASLLLYPPESLIAGLCAHLGDLRDAPRLLRVRDAADQQGVRSGCLCKWNRVRGLTHHARTVACLYPDGLTDRTRPSWLAFGEQRGTRGGWLP